jgi:hypothetical protein
MQELLEYIYIPKTNALTIHQPFERKKRDLANAGLFQE